MTLISSILAGLLVAAQPVEFVAHRGESADAPENTMAAFRLAWERKDEAIELDVHLTKDGSLVVSHDADTKRTTGVSQRIVESTAAEVRSLDAGGWKGSHWAGERLPLLSEALATIPPRARCFIEVKVGAEAIPALVEVVRASGKKPEQLAVISFHADAVAEAKRQLPEIKTYYLADFRRDGSSGTLTPGVDELIARAKELHADGLDLSFKGPIDRSFVDRVKAAELELYVWTVDDPAVARRMIEAGVDGITSNRPAWLKQRLGR
jgi:glycerophosphoryl diester phosphodiesterase